MSLSIDFLFWLTYKEIYKGSYAAKMLFYLHKENNNMASLRCCLARKNTILPGMDVARVGNRWVFIDFLIDEPDYEEEIY